MISLGGFARLAKPVGLDGRGHFCAMTFEHASPRTDVKLRVVERIAA